MTKLSYLILFAEMSNNFGLALTVIGFLLLIFAGFYAAYRCDLLEWNFYGEPGDGRKLNICSFIFGLIFLFIGFLAPSKQTIYMIGGVELINEFSKTEVAKELGEDGLAIVKDITSLIHSYTLKEVKGVKLIDREKIYGEK